MGLRLYIVEGSHPCAAVEKAMQLKGLAYSVWEWPPPLHAPMQKLLFGARTVPGLTIDRREKVSGSRAIMRRLDELAPEPRLYPEGRPEVAEADRWGDEVLQPIARELIWTGFTHRPDAMISYGQSSRLPMPAPVIRLSAPLITRAERRLNRTGDEIAGRRLKELPGHVARVDGWLAGGTLGGAEHPNAADLQILSTINLIATFEDARPALDGSRALEAATALFGALPGRLPAGAIPA